MKKNKKVKLELDLPIEDYMFLKEVSKLSGIKLDDVISVILSCRIVSEKYTKKADKK